MSSGHFFTGFNREHRESSFGVPQNKPQAGIASRISWLVLCEGFGSKPVAGLDAFCVACFSLGPPVPFYRFFFGGRVALKWTT